jgi:DNA-binding MarR family transcriptional regulator
MLSSLQITKSAVIVFFRLAQDGQMCPHQIMETAGLPPRTVTNALRQLLDNELCKRIPNLNDMRKPLYCVDKRKAREIERELEAIHSQIRMHLTGLR